ncbi:hypothetical protein ACYZTX_29025 [Pseudomonas sp. MDT1-17]
MPMIDTEHLKHALHPYCMPKRPISYAAVKAAAPMNKSVALDKAKKAQHVYHDACRRLCSNVRQAVENEETVAVLVRRMG